jgi:hypothetical protein
LASITIFSFPDCIEAEQEIDPALVDGLQRFIEAPYRL